MLPLEGNPGCQTQNPRTGGIGPRAPFAFVTLDERSAGDRATGGKPASTASSKTVLGDARLPLDERYVQVCRGLSHKANVWQMKRKPGAVDGLWWVGRGDGAGSLARGSNRPPRPGRGETTQPRDAILNALPAGADRSSGRSCHPLPCRIAGQRGARWCACSANPARPTNRAGDRPGHRHCARKSS